MVAPNIDHGLDDQMSLFALPNEGWTNFSRLSGPLQPFKFCLLFGERRLRANITKSLDSETAVNKQVESACA